MTQRLMLILVASVALTSPAWAGQLSYDCVVNQELGRYNNSLELTSPRIPVSQSKHFMIDKSSSSVVSEIFGWGYQWRVIEPGSKTQSFKIIAYSGNKPYYVITIAEYESGAEKPFVFLDIGIGTVLAGTCR